MNTVALLSIVAIVGCGLLAVLVGRGVIPGLSRTERRTGEELINNPLKFRTAADLDTVAAKLMADIAPERREESEAELHLALAEPTGDGASFVLIFCAGGGPSKVMETAVLLKPFGTGTAGSVGFEAWQTADGEIDAVAVQTAVVVREGVRKAVAELDPAAEFSEAA